VINNGRHRQPTVAPTNAGCQPATQQTDCLRYSGQPVHAARAIRNRGSASMLIAVAFTFLPGHVDKKRPLDPPAAKQQ
jgi:hypothetical protein